MGLGLGKCRECGKQAVLNVTDVCASGCKKEMSANMERIIVLTVVGALSLYVVLS